MFLFGAGVHGLPDDTLDDGALRPHRVIDAGAHLDIQPWPRHEVVEPDLEFRFGEKLMGRHRRDRRQRGACAPFVASSNQRCGHGDEGSRQGGAGAYSRAVPDEIVEFSDTLDFGGIAG